MTVFVDTSALYALLDESDANHRKAARWLSGPGGDPALALATHSYVVVESVALVRSRLGAAAVRVLLDALIPAVIVHYVEEDLHRAGIIAFRSSAGQKPSLVDRVSFEMMRDEGMDTAFAFDRDFAVQGFETVP